MDTKSPGQLGPLGEQLAVEHLVRRGLHIVERNFRTRWGELDIVARDGSTLVFCEVKARRVTAGAVDPFASIRAGKRSQVRKMARHWLADRPHHPFAEELRFDAIGVSFDARDRLLCLEHIEGAW